MKKLNLLFLLLMSALIFAQPSSGAAMPTHNAANVISIYGDTYTSIVTNFNPNWGQSGAVNDAYSAGGDNVLAYTNFNYQGTDLTATDMSSMEYLHIDVWTNDATVLKVSPINNGTGTGEILVDITLVSGGWSSVDLPKSSFTGMTWDSVFQMKFDAQAGTSPCNVYLDNIYFWKNPVDANADATLSDLQVDGATVDGFSSGVETYDVELPNGTTTVPTVTVTTTQSGASAVVTAATAIPGSTTVVVTAADGSTTKTYTVNFTEAIALIAPTEAAPTPPTRDAENVISVYGSAYGTAAGLNNVGWDGTTFTEETVGGDTTLKAVITTDNPFLGSDLGTVIDATEMTHFHMDYWVANPWEAGQIFNPKWSNHTGGSGETDAAELTVALPSDGSLNQTWVQLDVPVSDFNNVGGNGIDAREDLAQFLVTTAGYSSGAEIYIDNVYFYKEASLTVADVVVNAQKVAVYPNPVKAGEMIYVTNAETVAVYNMVGQLVETHKGNEFNTQGLKSGVYILKATDKDWNVSSTKLMVK